VYVRSELLGLIVVVQYILCRQFAPADNPQYFGEGARAEELWPKDGSCYGQAVGQKLIVVSRNLGAQYATYTHTYMMILVSNDCVLDMIRNEIWKSSQAHIPVPCQTYK
jgi:hypothetical protein